METSERGSAEARHIRRNRRNADIAVSARQICQAEAKRLSTTKGDVLRDRQGSDHNGMWLMINVVNVINGEIW